MADSPVARIWIGRAVYLAVAMAIIFLQLLPLDTAPPEWAPPDVLLAVTLAWVARRPEFLPFFVVFLVFLLTDRRVLLLTRNEIFGNWQVCRRERPVVWWCRLGWLAGTGSAGWAE